MTALGVVVGLASCAPRPAGDFELVGRQEIPDGTAVVYLYRPLSVLGGSGGCNITLGDEVIGALEAGRYTRRFLSPGKTRFEAAGGWVAFVTVNLQAGGEYFIRQRWLLGATGFEVRLDHMTRIRALPELETCSYVEAPTLLEEEDHGEGQE